MRLTRNTAVTCLFFGKSRRVLYPRHFFCQQCNLWERDRALVRKSAKRCSKTYRCEATHTSCLFPTTHLKLKEVYILSRHIGRRCRKENSSDSSKSSISNSDFFSSSSSSCSNTFQRAAPQPQTQHTKAEVAKLTWKIHKLDRENKALKEVAALFEPR
jgi:hypothetical protein